MIYLDSSVLGSALSADANSPEAMRLSTLHPALTGSFYFLGAKNVSMKLVLNSPARKAGSAKIA